MRRCSGFLSGIVHALLSGCGLDKLSPQLNQGLYLGLAAGVVPLLVARLVWRASWTDLGCRRPNPIGWRLLVVGFVASLPFLAFMALGEGMTAYYVPTMQRAGAVAFLSFYAVNMLTEHFLCHGVLLAAFRADRRWPPPPTATPIAHGPRWKRLLLFFGISIHSARVEQSFVTNWLQLQSGCGFAMAASAALFALIHVGKDWREAVLSLPGGLVLAFMAYRGNSWLIPFLLHTLTAATTLGLMILLSA